MKTTRKTSRDSRGRAHDVRTGKLLSEKEALRRERISAFAKRRVRGERGTYEKKLVRAVARRRPTERAFYKLGEKLHETSSRCKERVYDVEVDTEDFTEDEVRLAIDEDDPENVHFDLADIEEVERDE